MTTNVTKLSEYKNSVPTDLMSLSELSQKYKFKYDYLYKIVVRENKIPHYFTGKVFVSEKVFIVWLNGRFVPAREEKV